MRDLERRAPELVLLTIVGMLLAAGAVIGLALAVDPRHVLDVFVHPAWQWVPLALLAELIAYVGYIVAYRGTIRADGGVPLPFNHATVLVFAGFGAFIPRGGFAIDQMMLEQVTKTPRHARTRVLALGMLEYAVLAPVTVVAALIVIIRHEHISLGLTLPWVIGVSVGGVLALWAVRHREALRPHGGLRGWLCDALDAIALLRILMSPIRREAGGALAGMAVYWFADIFALWATLHAFLGDAPHIPQLIVGYATGYALTRRALPLAGAGAVEVLMPFSLSWIGEPFGAALAAVFFYRFVNLWLPLIPAFLAERQLRGGLWTDFDPV